MDEYKVPNVSADPDPDMIEKENDLVAIALDRPSHTAATDVVWVEWSSAAIALYTSNNKTTGTKLVPPDPSKPRSYPFLASSLPRTIYLEGVSPSASARDQWVALKHSYGTSSRGQCRLIIGK